MTRQATLDELVCKGQDAVSRTPDAPTLNSQVGGPEHPSAAPSSQQQGSSSEQPSKRPKLAAPPPDAEHAAGAGKPAQKAAATASSAAVCAANPAEPQNTDSSSAVGGNRTSSHHAGSDQHGRLQQAAAEGHHVELEGAAGSRPSAQGGPPQHAPASQPGSASQTQRGADETGAADGPPAGSTSAAPPGAPGRQAGDAPRRAQLPAGQARMEEVMQGVKRRPVDGALGDHLASQADVERRARRRLAHEQGAASGNAQPDVPREELPDARRPLAPGKPRPDNLLEEGRVFFLYRPRVSVEQPHSVLDIQRFFMVLSPTSRPGAPNRLLIIGKKRLPMVETHERFYGFVEAVSGSVEELLARLGPAHYDTATQGSRTVEPARIAGKGVYTIVRSAARQTHLAYQLELPLEAGPAQQALGIAPQAAYLLSLKNPESGASRYYGLPDKADYPARARDLFGSNAWAPALDPALLDYPHAEFLLIGTAPVLPGEGGQEVAAHLQDATHADLQESAAIGQDHLQQAGRQQSGGQPASKSDQAAGKEGAAGGACQTGAASGRAGSGGPAGVDGEEEGEALVQAMREELRAWQAHLPAGPALDGCWQ